MLSENVSSFKYVYLNCVPLILESWAFNAGFSFIPGMSASQAGGRARLNGALILRNSEKLSGILGQPQMAGLLSFALCITQLF